MEKAAYKSYKNVTSNYFAEIIKQKTILVWGLNLYNPMPCNIALRVHFFDSHLDFFLENLGAVSDFTRIFLHGKSVPKQVESQHAGRLLPDT